MRFSQILILIVLVGCSPSEKAETLACRVDGPEIRDDFDLERAYPKLAMKRGVEGRVTVEYTVDANGKLESFKVLEANPVGSFENATKREFGRMRWYPETNSHCQPVTSKPQVKKVTYWLGCSPAYLCE